MVRSIPIFLVLLGLPSPVPGATLTGVVTDSATAQPLPYVNVLLPELGRGGATDLHGAYTLTALPSGAWRIQVSSIGYRTFAATVRLDPDTVTRLPVTLPPAPIPLKPDVSLPARSLQDLLRGIAQKAHEKFFHARYDALHTYRFSTHGTQILYAGQTVDTGIRARIEYDGEGYYRNPDRMVQVITAYRTHRSTDRAFGMHPGVTVNIRKGHLNGREFDAGPLPLDAAARKRYRYRILDRVQMGDVAVYHLRVTPRKKRRPALEGDVWVSGADFSLVGYDLKLNRALLKKLEISELRTYQENALYHNRYWLPTRQIIRIRTATGALAEQITHIDGYTFNPPLPDSLTSAGPLTILPGATARGTAYWSARADRLKIAEQDAVQRLIESNVIPPGWRRLMEK